MGASQNDLYMTPTGLMPLRALHTSHFLPRVTFGVCKHPISSVTVAPAASKPLELEVWVVERHRRHDPAENPTYTVVPGNPAPAGILH